MPTDQESTNKKILYMLFALEAKMRVQQDLLIEIADILTKKDPDAIKNEVTLKTIQELKNVRDQMNQFKEVF